MRIPAASPASGSGSTRVSSLARHPGASPRAACPGRPGGRALPSSARRACPTPRVARGTARTGCRAAVSSVPRRSLDRRARSADSAAGWPQAGTRSGRRPRCGASRPGGPRVVSRPFRPPSTTDRCPSAHLSAAARWGRDPREDAIDSRPTASATTATRRRSRSQSPPSSRIPAAATSPASNRRSSVPASQGGDRGPGRQPAGPRHLNAP